MERPSCYKNTRHGCCLQILGHFMKINTQKHLIDDNYVITVAVNDSVYERVITAHNL